MKAVDQYLNDILAPTLRKHGASENYQQLSQLCPKHRMVIKSATGK